MISARIEKSSGIEERLKESMTKPLCKYLDEAGYKYEIKSRVTGKSSISRSCSGLTKPPKR